MTYTDFNPEVDRYGSADFADRQSIASAGLFHRDGVPIGYFDNQQLRLDGDAPLLTIGGAGSGKMRDLLGYTVCDAPPMPMISLDPRGEQAAVSRANLAPRNIHGYYWNALQMCGLPQHRCNPLDILKPDDPHLYPTCQFIVAGLIPLSGSGSGKYFELRAREWVEGIAMARVEQNGKTSLPDLYRVIGTIEGDPEAWVKQLEFMLQSKFESVRRVASEMLTKQQDGAKEFTSIMGEIYAYTSFLNDPVLRASLEDGFSLSVLTNQSQLAHVYLNVPAEYLSIWSPVIRIFFTVTMLYKSRRPEARRILLLVDEAGQLGRFEGLVRAFTYGRGAGIRAWALFQDIGQIEKNYGAATLQTFMGSAQMRQFFGIRDYKTAKLVFDMLGTQTLQYDDTLRQQQASRQRYNAARDVLLGGDPFAAANDHAHFERESQYRSKQSRPLLSPDEILRLPEDKQILFISGKNLRPILADKHPYYTRREMAGKYLPNPYHPPSDSVVIKTRFGSKRVRVVSGAVPQRYRLFPQYEDGTALWLEGYPLS